MASRSCLRPHPAARGGHCYQNFSCFFFPFLFFFLHKNVHLCKDFESEIIKKKNFLFSKKIFFRQMQIFHKIPLNKSVFTLKTRHPLKKRVAPSDSSKNFGLGGMLPQFFYHDRIARQKLFLSCFSRKSTFKNA